MTRTVDMALDPRRLGTFRALDAAIACRQTSPVRVFVSSNPLVGHIVPLVPLARALVSAGHELRWVTHEEMHEFVQGFGFSTIAAGQSRKASRRALLESYPDIRELQHQALHDFFVPRYFGEIVAPAMLADLVQVIADWSPTVIVHESGEFAAPVASALAGCLKVTVGTGPGLSPTVIDDVAARTAPLWLAHGLEPPRWAGLYEPLCVDAYPRSLRRPDNALFPEPLSMRTAANARDDVDAEPPLPPGDSPLVYMTFGTVFNSHDGVFSSAVRAIAALGVRSLVTVGADGDPTAFGPLPSTIRVERFVPQDLVLPRASVVVSHAGSGTMLAAVTHGLPQLCLPQGADQFDNAASVERSGAGLALRPDEASPETIREAVQRLLSDGAFTGKARLLQEEIAAMPSPTSIVSELEQLTDRRVEP